MIIYNTNLSTDSCRVDLDTFGDNTGMTALFNEAGLSKPADDGYYIESDLPVIRLMQTV